MKKIWESVELAELWSLSFEEMELLKTKPSRSHLGFCDIWGEGTTSCASNSKKFGSWDQNLMTEWHIRYGEWCNDLLVC